MSYPRKLTDAQEKAIALAYRPYRVTLRELAAVHDVSEWIIRAALVRAHKKEAQ